MILLLSAQGTGTNFTLQFMRGVDMMGLHSCPIKLQQVIKELGPLEANFKKVVIPLRHPWKSYRSGIRTGVTHEMMIAQWRNLIAYSKVFQDIYYVPVEVPEPYRMPLMQGLAAFVGMDFTAREAEYTKEWKPKNQHPWKQPWVDPIHELDFAEDWFRETLEVTTRCLMRLIHPSGSSGDCSLQQSKAEQSSTRSEGTHSPNTSGSGLESEDIQSQLAGSGVEQGLERFSHG